MSGPSSAVVAGALANKVGNGGEAWVRPTWTLGLARLGFDAWLVEELPADLDDERVARAASWFGAVTQWFGMGERCALVHGDRTVVGPELDRVRDVLGDAVLFVNVSGHLRRLDLPTPRATRVYLDVDPGFTQVWAAQGLLELGEHHRHVTVGTAVGSEACPLPTCAHDWIPTLPPVLIERWRPTALPDTAPRTTTVTSWRPPHGPVSWEGVDYGVKAHEFREHLSVPASASPVSIELALAIDEGDEADRRRLVEAGFELVDPAVVAGTPWAFADYVGGSWAEWSVAQGVYVHGRTGWVSDRSAHYLAAARPVVAQDTGSFLAGAEGWWTFEDPGGAAMAVKEVVADPVGACQAARALAERCFDSDLVLGGLCDRIGVSP
jgi:hypothetical protein